MSQDKEKNKEAKVLSHNYDGIQELDNPLPKWWLFTFYITIVFSIFYYGYYELYGGPSSDKYLSQSLSEIQKKKVSVKETSSETLKSFDELVSNKEMMELGKGHFSSKCAPCHGQKGEGVIGPNLTDSFWISSKGNLEGVLVAIQKGFPDKGMPAWKALIPAKEQPYLAAYVMTLKGTNPPNAKAPQGDKVE